MTGTHLVGLEVMYEIITSHDERRQDIADVKPKDEVDKAHEKSRQPHGCDETNIGTREAKDRPPSV